MAMPNVTGYFSTRFLSAITGYVLLVAISTYIFNRVVTTTSDDFHYKYLYSLGGPTLSFFTHMGYFLFVEQSGLLIAWLALGALKPRLVFFRALVFG